MKVAICDFRKYILLGALDYTQSRNIRIWQIHIMCKFTWKHATSEKSTVRLYQSQKM